MDVRLPFTIFRNVCLLLCLFYYDSKRLLPWFEMTDAEKMDEKGFMVTRVEDRSRDLLRVSEVCS